MIQNIHLLASTRFETAKLAAGLVAQFDSVADPLGSEQYMLTGAFDSLDLCKKQRIDKPTQFPLTTTLVVFSDTAVVVAQEYSTAEQNRSARNFVAWLLSLYDCRIQDEYGKDRTDDFHQGGMAALFGKEMEKGARGPAMSAKSPIQVSIVPGEDEPFDTNMIHSRLIAQFESLLDPLGSGTILLCGLREHVQGYERLRVDNPAQFPACPTVRIEPDCIHMTFADVDVNRERSARNFILWVQHEYPMARIVDSDGVDVTDDCYTDGIRVLFANTR